MTKPWSWMVNWCAFRNKLGFWTGPWLGHPHLGIGRLEVCNISVNTLRLLWWASKQPILESEMLERQMVRWRETQTLPTSHIIQWVWTNKRDSGEQIVQEWVTTKGCTGWAVNQLKRESSPQQNTAFSQRMRLGSYSRTTESFDLWYWTPKTQTLVFAKWWESKSSGLGGVNASHVNTSVVWLI